MSSLLPCCLRMLVVVFCVFFAGCNLDDDNSLIGSNDESDSANNSDDMGSDVPVAGGCTTSDLTSCMPLPNAEPLACVEGACVYSCRAGFVDENEDLSMSGSDGCESDCIPSGDVEICDGVDNDCDGAIDNGFSTGMGCSDGVGECEETGAFVCNSAGDDVLCDAQASQPAEETCDGLDNDCDGEVDEEIADVGTECDTGQPGECAAGTFACNNGTLECVPDNAPENETCDQLDNDCDGDEDEENPGGGGACDTGEVGICAQGSETCMDGALTCVQNQNAANDELCGTDNMGDGVDNDCDGDVDEGCAECVENETRDCYTGSSGTEDVGRCQGGEQTCVNGSWSACVGEILPTAESCNSVDDDCDGMADEDFGTLGQGCTVGTGACENTGTIVCTSDGLTTECSATPGTPQNESCNGVDDNCNGSVDEGVKTRFYFDADNDGYGTSSSQNHCNPSGNYRATATNDCNDSNSSINPGADENCESSIDYDCDNESTCGDSDCQGRLCNVPRGGTGACVNNTCDPNGCMFDSQCRSGEYCKNSCTPGICCPNGQNCFCGR